MRSAAADGCRPASICLPMPTPCTSRLRRDQPGCSKRRCATGVCCDGSGRGVGASPVGVAAIGATSTCGTADGFACAAAHCRLPRSWDRLSRVLPRSWDHLVASNGNTWRVVPGCPRRSGRSTRVGADRRAAGPVLSADVSVLRHRPGRCRVGRRCAGAGPDVRADCPPAVSRTGRGPERDSWEERRWWET